MLAKMTHLVCLFPCINMCLMSHQIQLYCDGTDNKASATISTSGTNQGSINWHLNYTITSCCAGSSRHNLSCRGCSIILGSHWSQWGCIDDNNWGMLVNTQAEPTLMVPCFALYFKNPIVQMSVSLHTILVWKSHYMSGLVVEGQDML